MSVYSCVCVCEVSILGEQLLVEAGGAQTTPAQICLVRPIIPKCYWHIRPDICGIFFSLHVSKQQAFCNFCTRVPVVKPLEKSVLNCKWKKKKRNHKGTKCHCWLYLTTRATYLYQICDKSDMNIITSLPLISYCTAVLKECTQTSLNVFVSFLSDWDRVRAGSKSGWCTKRLGGTSVHVPSNQISSAG